MKRRNREINIFNLSMMDVISGAMAAFLILVVIMAPYYHRARFQSPSKTRPGITVDKKVLELQQALVRATTRLDFDSVPIATGSLQSADLEKGLIAAKGNVEHAIQLAAAAAVKIRQLRSELKAARQKIKNLTYQVSIRTPFVVESRFVCKGQPTVSFKDLPSNLPATSRVSAAQYQRLMARMDNSGAKVPFATSMLYDVPPGISGDPIPRFDAQGLPSSAGGEQMDMRPTVFDTHGGMTSTASLAVDIVPPGSKFKLYYVLLHTPKTDCIGTSELTGNKFSPIKTPAVTLSAERRIAFVGTFTHQPDHPLVFIPASPEAQQQEETAISKAMHR